ncbi:MULTISPECIES: ATP-binding cassette domain-containing protein [Nonomuraea]|uniref:ATP-binding cassette domain-containing protein n=2 Tax=Nonomuraea TaxID=83681 RepID=A0ABW1BT74_9ACTN|nr:MULTISPECIES: ATP-binding cassette domain-containing protein [Nonomuraea]MDA0641473.1 ATP-binding cassette domain-containing protein [Nonomuraea ferruginea]TXK42092.1 sugar ABC transporter ATP-binding protein [Nonomuraea sp. C10]
MTAPPPVLDVAGVTKSYGHVQALRGVDLQVRPREVHALVGDNGAGKSTLMKIIAGAVSPDSGTIAVDGRPVTFARPADAQAAGIETVYQDLALAPTLTAGENLYLGREVLKPGLLGRLGFVDRAAMNRSAERQLSTLGAKLQSLASEVGSLSGGQKQAVAVARASLWGSALIMLDEPTAALGVSQTEFVLKLVEQLRDERGLSVLLISHSMPDVFRVADRVTVLRLGQTVLTEEISALSTNDLIAAMTGAGIPAGGPTT